MINSAGDEGVDKYHSSIMGEGPQDDTQLMELVVTASCDQVDVLRKTKFLIKCHPKVTNSKRKGNMGEGLGQQV